MPITNSKEKFGHELAEMYDAEHQFLLERIAPRLRKAAA